MTKVLIINPQISNINEELSDLKDRLQFGHAFHLLIKSGLSSKQLDEVCACIESLPEFSLAKLSLEINQDSLANPNFLNLIERLQKISPKVLELHLPDEALKQSAPAIEQQLMTLATIADFPIIILNAQTQKKIQFKAFEEKMIQAIQNKPKTELINEAKDETDSPAIPLGPLNPDDESSNPYIQIEVEHVEEHEQRIEEAVEVEKTAEIQMAKYKGKFVDYYEFNTEHFHQIAKRSHYTEKQIEAAFKYAEYEWFANLPHAVKYLSWAAAEKLAANLPQWVALNKENLPPGFILKESYSYEYVLDYDPLAADNENDHPFCPQEFIPDEHQSPYYDIDFDETKLKTLINNPNIRPKNTLLMNVWLRYGYQGIQTFFAKLNQLDQQHPGLSEFIFLAYLSHFNHLEPFYNDVFFDSLDKLKHYSALQINCLKRFLKDTGDSHHDLAKTLEAFDYFWNQLSLLCHEDQQLLALIDTKWICHAYGQPAVDADDKPAVYAYGQPAVYMERLLTILSNARDLRDQLQSLDGLYLDAYGAYYASNYEQFTCVHVSMGFEYDPDSLFNQNRFNPNFQLYASIDLDILTEIAQEDGKYVNDQLNNGLIVLPFSSPQCTQEELDSFRKEKQIIPYIKYATNYIDLPYHALYEPMGKQAFKKTRDYLPHQALYVHMNDMAFRNRRQLPVSAKKYYQLIYRFMGMQLSGMGFSAFYKEWQEIRNKIERQGHSYTQSTDSLAKMDANYSLPIRLLQCLFFITNERYKGIIENGPKLISGTSDHKTDSPLEFMLLGAEGRNIDNMLTTLSTLKQLHDKNTRLNEMDGIYLAEIQKLPPPGFKSVETDAADYEQWKRMVEQYPHRIFFKLMSNKYGTLRFIHFFGRQKEKINTSYALNTHDFFSSESNIADTFRDELLLFSGLLCNTDFNVERCKFKEEMEKKERADVLELKQIRDYLQRATLGDLETNYLHYAMKRLVDAEQFVSNKTVLAIFSAVSQLKLVDNHLDHQAIKKVFDANHLPMQIRMPGIFQSDNFTIKRHLIALIHELDKQARLNNDFEPLDLEAQKQAQLPRKTIVELQAILKAKMAASNKISALLQSQRVKMILNDLREYLISEQFLIHGLKNSSLGTGREISPFMRAMATIATRLSDLKTIKDFEELDRVIRRVEPLAISCGAIQQHACVLQHQEEFIALLDALPANKLDSDCLHALMNMLTKMPRRDYWPILKSLLNDSELIEQREAFLPLMALVNKFHAQQLTTATIVNFCHRYREFHQENSKTMEEFSQNILKAYAKDVDDTLSHFFLTQPGLTFKAMTTLAGDTSSISDNRDKLAKLFEDMANKKQLEPFINETGPLQAQQKINILVILAKAFSTRRPQDPEINPSALIKLLSDFSDNQLQQLYALYESTPISLACLNHALTKGNAKADFAQFLESIEKAPFGKRDFKEQFNCREVERVVNQSGDLMNKTPYSYSYRKQWMEAFLLVNAMGSDLAVFQGKPAHDLTNQELKTWFAKLKENKNPDLKSKLSSLALIREAMYRSTGQFPYSTQMLVVIDCMLHQGDVISKVETGQGKSLVDTMKAAFLWTMSDRVDMTTSSLVDAKRDLANYGPFFELLGIPFAHNPIQASSDVDEFCRDGINVSTLSQLSLFHAKALVSNKSLDQVDDRVSFIPNESDYSLLDDLTVKRFASAKELKITKKQEWIYEAINDYVETRGLSMDNIRLGVDLRGFRKYLVDRAKTLRKNPAIIEHFDRKLLLRWIESAIVVKDNLREDFKYGIFPVPGQVERYEAKVLMKDTRPSPDSVFGQGMQQLLHARLNQKKRIKTKSGEPAFEIKPESTTIISSSNDNMLEYYLSRQGWIWGSSGTPGSTLEMDELYAKYGFGFSWIEPHQAKQVIEKDVVILPNETAQYNRLSQEVKARKKRQTPAPTLIFCENIEKAKKLYAHLINSTGKDNIQLFTGSGDEETLIKQAGLPGMITVTTSAIGRNTDVPYDKKYGLDIWHTVISSSRLDTQKSGRTGRQGSKGVISYFLNTEDQGIKSREDVQVIRTRLDESGRKEREFHEAYFKITGRLLAQIKDIPSRLFTGLAKSEFLMKKWATFSNNLEQQYRKLKHRAAFEPRLFAQQAIETLAPMIQEAAPQYDVKQLAIAQELLHQKKDPYNPYLQKVKIADCIPPLTIAHELFYAQMPSTEVELNEEDKQKIRQELKQLFANPTSHNFMKKHEQFFRFLHTSPANQAAIRAIYQSFLQEFLVKPKGLNQIANNPHYLCLFRAMASIDKTKPVLEPEIIKNAIDHLIEEYLQNSWFISREKREAAIELQRSIQASKQIDNVIAELINSQLSIAKMDIQSNQKRWRSVNFFGQSRLQSTISRALALAASLGIQIQSDKLILGLTAQLNGIITKNPLSSDKIPSLDEIKHIEKAPKSKDKSNVRVLAKSISQALELPKPLEKEEKHRREKKPSAT